MMTNVNDPLDVWTHADPETEWTITRTDGQPDKETITKPNGDQFYRDFTYNSNNILIKRSKWKKV